MADLYFSIPVKETAWWSDPIVVPVTLDVDPRSGRYLDARLEAMEEWARAPEQVGQFVFDAHDSVSVRFQFANADTAFAFKMKFG